MCSDFRMVLTSALTSFSSIKAQGTCCIQWKYLFFFSFFLTFGLSVSIDITGLIYPPKKQKITTSSSSNMPRHVPGWENPYVSSLNHHQTQASVNYQRVLARKAEKLFELQMKTDGSLDQLESIKMQLANQDRSVVVPDKKQKILLLKPTVMEPLKLRPTHSVSGPIRTLEIAQAGATTWTAECDGGISVRSGASGEVVVAIPPREEGSTVDTLFATDTHMWAGMSNGTVVVYDHLVFVQVTEGTFHTGPVTAFAQVADGRMISASEDGSLIKWDSESKNFEAITRIVPQELGAISCVCSQGLVIFCGSTTGTLASLDSDKGIQLCNFEGHQGSITAVACVDAYLFSASVDRSVRIWNVTSGAALKVHPTESAPCALIPVPSTHRIWVAFSSGLLQVWKTQPDDGFSIERTVRVHEGRTLLTAKSMTAVETLKIWTLASDGVNKVWSSTYNRAEEGLRSTVEALKAVITQDTIELDKWRGLVARLEIVEHRRRAQLAVGLSAYHRDLVFRRALWTWMKWLKMRQEHRRRELVSERLALETKTTQARSVFAKWYTWYREAQRQTTKRRFADACATMHNANLQGAYAMRAIFASRQEKMLNVKLQLVNAVAALGNHGVQHAAFRKWMRFSQVRRDVAVQERNAKALAWFNEKLLIRRYLSCWMRVQEKVLERRQLNNTAVTLQRLNELRILRRYVGNWLSYRAQCQRLKERSALAVMLEHTNRLDLMQRAYSQWCAAIELHKLQDAHDANEKVRSQLSTIRQRYNDLSALLEEKRKISALKKKGVEDDAKLNKARNRVAALERERIRLEQVRAEKQADDDGPGDSIHDQLEHVMSQLKASVINYYADCTLFHQVKEKIRAGQPVSKLFLEAHQAVKRVVVEVTRNPHLSAFERWPLSPELLQRIPPHHLSSVLGAIKSMIITFDIMDKSDHDQLISDQEIVLNAQWLMVMAKQAMSHKKKLTAVRR